jgi:cytochrome c-type biogenesis protein CcmH/NrfG
LRLELGLEESARDPLNQRISLGYADAETCWLLAEATRRSGDPVAALGAYQRAFEFGEQPPNVLVSASTLYFDDRVRGHCPEARQLVRRWLRDATARDPQNTEAHYYLGLVLIDCDREDEALRRLRRAVETDPTHVPSLTQLARLHARRGELDGARQMAERALDLVDSESERRQLEELLATASGDTAEPLR